MIHLRRVARTFIAVALAGSTSAAFAATCTVSKAQIEAALASGATPEELYAQYGNCTADDPGAPPGSVCTVGTAPPATPSNDDEALLAEITNPAWPPTQIITNTGSTYYEAMTSCGYHPQKKQAACVIEIRQRFGFAGPPGGGPGSFEHVLLCVDLGVGGVVNYVPINIGSVHVHDEAFGVQPRWYFTALIPANSVLAGRPLNGQTYAARAILSWAWAPPLTAAACNTPWRPVWGNQIDFRIRLDP
jgi:hypothetical protein